MNILELIKDSSNLIHLNLGKSFDEVLETKKDEIVMIVPYSVLLDPWGIEKLFDAYSILELFDLSNCYLDSYEEQYMLWHVSKEKPSFIKTSIFHRNAHPYKIDIFSNVNHDVPDKFSSEFLEYLDILNEWIKSSKIPRLKMDTFELNCIPYSEFRIQQSFPSFYRKSNTKFREMFNNSEMIELSEAADVFRTSLDIESNNKEVVKTLDGSKNLNYPYVPELCAIDGVKTNQVLHKEDIVELNNQYFLINVESEFTLYAPLGSRIIRATKLCPEYLYLYLNSNIAMEIASKFKPSKGTNTIKSDLSNFPVLIPKKSNEFYIDEFKKISSPNYRYYLNIDNKKPSDFEDVLSDETIQKITINNEATLKKQIDEDIKELNECFKCGAYKATLILAGSIMEAILIDWLSEIKGVDYFKVNLQKRKYDKEKGEYIQNKKGKYIYKKNSHADLSDYIDEIRDLKKPNWMIEHEKAHEIRKNRNLVHAKLCLKENVNINESLCKEVIKYLEEIIESRYNL